MPLHRKPVPIDEVSVGELVVKIIFDVMWWGLWASLGLIVTQFETSWIKWFVGTMLFFAFGALPSALELPMIISELRRRHNHSSP